MPLPHLLLSKAAVLPSEYELLILYPPARMQASLEVAALPYQDLPIKTILVLSSFLLFLNVINNTLDSLIYCGLVGQVLIGIAFGTPGTKWLDKSTEEAIVQLGYIGLILLVYEGGLTTNFQSLKANAGISTLVTLTGICLPIAFAFCLCSLASAKPLQAFTAGAALCSTSLETTFSILSSSGLTNTRLGTVVTSAAMMDDVVGLVLVQVISKLGPGLSSFHAITVVRPIAVSIGLALSVIFACIHVVKPLCSSINDPGSSIMTRVKRKHPDEVTLVAHTALLFGMVVAASYAGTSNLFAAYLAGASISWYYSEVAQLRNVTSNEPIEIIQLTSKTSVQIVANNEDNGAKIENQNTLTDGIDRGATLNNLGASSAQASQDPERHMDETKQVHGSLRGVSIYKQYMEQPVARVLNPFFCASSHKIRFAWV